MNTVRLLPIVIVAISALLVLKGIGLVTDGAYVLTGIGEAQAAGGGGHEATAAPVSTGETLEIAADPTMTDSSPTLTDTSPMLPGLEPAHGGGGHDAPADHGSEVAAVPATRCAVEIDMPGTLVMPPAGGTDQGNAGAAPGASLGPDCVDMTDAVPIRQDESGTVIPLSASEGGSLTEEAVLARLAERRAELEAYGENIAMREALVAAAEQRIEQRLATLQAVEEQINALVAERQAIEEGQFAGVVSMYETMRPGDAAAIFDQLDMEVLLRVSRAMNPRKMAPILAEMTASRAQELTMRLAAVEPEPVIDTGAIDLATLPQIVGQ